jgi:hypothetical protein
MKFAWRNSIRVKSRIIGLWVPHKQIGQAEVAHFQYGIWIFHHDVSKGVLGWIKNPFVSWRESAVESIHRAAVILDGIIYFIFYFIEELKRRVRPVLSAFVACPCI